MTSPVTLSIALVTRIGRVRSSAASRVAAADGHSRRNCGLDDSTPRPQRNGAVALSYGCRYTRGPGRGLYANRNHASLACRGDHIVSADDDHTHPSDYVAVIKELIAADPARVWIFSERWPGDADSPLVCPPELHRSGFGSAPADPSRCAAIADGASVYPRRIFDSGLRYDETYAFGGLWYLWGKLLADRGWRITFSDRTFVWHHFWPDQATPDDGRFLNRRQLRQQLLATTYVQFVGALWLDRSPVKLGWGWTYGLRRLLVPDSIIHFRVRRVYRSPARRAPCGWRYAPGAPTSPDCRRSMAHVRDPSKVGARQHDGAVIPSQVQRPVAAVRGDCRTHGLILQQPVDCGAHALDVVEFADQGLGAGNELRARPVGVVTTARHTPSLGDCQSVSLVLGERTHLRARYGGRKGRCLHRGVHLHSVRIAASKLFIAASRFADAPKMSKCTWGL